jgi:DNA-binding NarL/FixJ family response regulator
VRALLANEPDVQLVGQALNGKQVLEELEKNHVDIVLLDVNMPEMDGIETTRTIRQRGKDVKIVMLTMHNNPEFIFGLMNAGANGYILKNTGKEELMEAIQAVFTGKTFYSKEVSETILQNFSKRPAEQKADAVHLTEREKEVLTCLVKGMSYKLIADACFISVDTVRGHIKNIYEKLQVHSKSEAVVKAIRGKIV